MSPETTVPATMNESGNIFRASMTRSLSFGMYPFGTSILIPILSYPARFTARNLSIGSFTPMDTKILFCRSGEIERYISMISSTGICFSKQHIYPFAERILAILIVPTVPMFAAVMGIQSNECVPIRFLNSRQGSTSDLELSVERCGAIRTSSKSN